MGTRDTLLGREFIFPDNIKGLSNSVTEMIPARGKKYAKLANIKATDEKRYEKATDIGAKNFMKKFNDKYSGFNLGIYDVDEYQLSVLKFDQDK